MDKLSTVRMSIQAQIDELKAETAVVNEQLEALQSEIARLQRQQRQQMLEIVSDNIRNLYKSAGL